MKLRRQDAVYCLLANHLYYPMIKFHLFPILITPFLSGIFAPELFAQKIEFSGVDLSPITITPKKDTGLSAIYVLYNVTNAKINISMPDSRDVNINKFSSLGAAFGTPVENFSKDGNVVTIYDIEGDCGYAIQSGSTTDYIWIIDYSKHVFNIQAMDLSSDSTCDETILNVVGDANAINYFTINGRKETLSRDINIEYNNLEFDENSLQFIEKKIVKNLEFINNNIFVSPPILCSTEVMVSGDRFLKDWHQEKTITSNSISPIATAVFTTATEENSKNENSDPSNEISSESEYLGGSAPAEISFRSYSSDAVIHNEWQLANDEEFNDITYRFNQADLDYTFTTEGTTYVRFVGSNNDGSCVSYGDVYTVSIGSSELRIPNAFSPNDDGVNDIWKISYKSLLEFKCWIFDKQGHQLYYFDDPSGGWDGKSGGRLVKPGVYYYVIQAIGSDGKKYRKSGDINIIRSKVYSNHSSDL